MRPMLSSFKGKNILLLTHSGADVDAIASAACLFHALKSKNRVTIGVPEHITLPAKAFASNTKTKFKLNPNPDSFDCIFLLDLNELSMLGKMQHSLRKFNKPVYLIDHHTKPKKLPVPKENALVDDEAIATVQIIYRLLKKNKTKITPAMATSIACGIITDSAFFMNSSSEVFQTMAEMLNKSRKSLSSLIGTFKVRKDFSEKIAMLKAAKRCRIFKLGNYIVAISDVGAFEADAAATLIRIGADVAFVGDIENGKLRLSGRASREIVKKMRLDLAQHVFQKLGKHFQGSGGGHAAAAGFRGNAANMQNVLVQCVSLTRQFLQQKNRSIQLKEYT